MNGIDDVEDHTNQDQQHTKANGYYKYHIQAAYQGNIHHCAHGFQPKGMKNFLKTEETAIHKAEEGGENTGAGDDARQIQMFYLVKDDSAQEEQKSPVLHRRTWLRK